MLLANTGEGGHWLSQQTASVCHTRYTFCHCCKHFHAAHFANQMEQHALRSMNNGLNSSIYSYLETSGGQSSNLYKKVAHFFNTSLY
jgi:hypothetical protein